MVRETRHLWVGNLPDNVREDRIRDHFKRYGRVQSVKLLAGLGPEGPAAGAAGEPGEAGPASGAGSGGLCAAVAFMDIKSAAKAHDAEHALDDRPLTAVYYEPSAIAIAPPPPQGAPGADAAYPGASGSGGAGGGGPAGGGTAGVGAASERARPRDRAYRNGPASYSGSAVDRCAPDPVPDGASLLPPLTCDLRRSRVPPQRWYSGYGTSPGAGGEGAEAGARRRGRSGSSSGSGSSGRSASSSSPGRSASSSSSRASSPSAGRRRKRQRSGGGSGGRPLAICVRNLPQRSSDSSLKDGLFHEYKKHGKVSCVKVVGVNQDRYAVVCFKKPSDAEKALEVSQDKLFFGCKISVGPHRGADVEDNESRPYETDLDEFHPKATRTLFVGNLEKDATPALLREKFKLFGKIIEIDVKKQSGGAAGYAFCQYANISSVVEAIRNMDGEHVGGSRVKLGFGKSMATPCIWIDGVTELSEKQVFAHCQRIGSVSQISLCNGSGHALVVFEQVASAQQAVKELRGLSVRGRKLQVDFASRECQDAFYEQLEKQCNSSSASESRGAGAGDRFPELPPRAFDSAAASKYGRYEEFSGGSGSEAAYDGVNSVGAAGSGSGPALQSVVVVSSPASCPPVPPPPLAPNIRHLQKERVHLLEQLEECPSSGDELVSPKKRFKGDRLTLGRRPSAETSNRHHRDVSPCIKRRRGSEASRHRWHTPSPASRPGTPLHDERPDSPVPTEPRRPAALPRRSVPMCLPLPRFAAQVLPRAAPASPPRPPPGPPPPASPTNQRAPSPASSPGSSPSPAEPSLDERIRSLDERYEKWSGSRASSLSECAERSRFRHHLLDLDVTEVQPSEVMRSVLAKRSVFDEDSKRLESICDKYDAPARTACAFPSPSGARVSPSPLNSPQSAGRSPYASSPGLCSTKAAAAPAAPPAKGLQYPFPSHPPVPTAPASEQPPGDPAEDAVRAPFAERLSNHVDAPRGGGGAPAGVGFGAEPASGPAPRAPPRGVSAKCESKTSKNSENRSPSNRDSSVVNVSELDVVAEGDLKTKCGVVNSDNLDRRKIEHIEVGLIKLDSDVKENRDQSFKQKCVSEKPLNDKKIGEKTICNVYPDNRIHGDILRLEYRKLSVADKVSEPSERKKFAKDEKITRSSERDGKKIESDRKKREEPEDGSVFPDDPVAKSPAERAQVDSRDRPEREADERASIETENVGRERLENERREREQMEKEKIEKERIDKERKEREKIERERLDKDRREKDKLEQVERERIERELVEKERREKEKAERERREKERAERDRRERERVERERADRSQREKVEKEKTDRDRQDRDKTEKDNKLEKDKHDAKFEKHEKRKEKEVKRKDERDSADFAESLYKEKRKEKDDHGSEIKHRHRDAHKKDAHVDRGDSKKDVSSKNHDGKYKDSNRKISRDESFREILRKDSSDSTGSRNSHESVRSKEHENSITEIKDELRLSSNKSNKIDNHKNRHHDKECSPKSSTKEEIDFRTEPAKSLHPDKRDRLVCPESEKTHHSDQSLKDKRLSVEDKPRHYSFDSHNDHRSHEFKRKERLNSSCSLPAGVGLKRRISSQDALDHDDCKKPKLCADNKKIPERRDSRDSNKHFDKNRHNKITKNNISKQLEDKIRDDKRIIKEFDEKYKNKEIKERDYKEINDGECADRHPRERDGESKCDSDSKEKETRDHSRLKLNDKMRNKKSFKEFEIEMKIESLMTDEERNNSIDREFLERLELRSSQEDERQQALKKEMKERKRIHQLQQIQQLQLQQTALQQDDKKVKTEDRKKEIKEKRISTDRKSRDECPMKIENIRKKPRKITNSTDTSDSDEPKKHSIFDIVDEGPTYISMYDKVKARSCKNMQKQEEEKRQEKIKAKFSQLKQSRAKREEKKRSTSWDEDSDSDRENKKSTSKSLIASSSEDEFRRHHRDHISTDSENDIEKLKMTQSKHSEVCDGDSTDDARNKLISRKNSRSRIMSDTSDDEGMKRALDKREMEAFPNSEFSERDEKKHIKMLQKDDSTEIKEEPPDTYENKPPKGMNKCHFYENALKTHIDDKKSLAEHENEFIKSEHYIKKEPVYKYNSKYSDIEYDLFSEEVILSDSLKTKNSELRKKHKKKQKRQKSYISDEDSIGVFEKMSIENFEIHKRKHSNKKDKKREREKSDEFDVLKDKLKLKKPKRITDVVVDGRSESVNNFKRGEIMNDIFGPLSDECDEKIQDNFEPPVFNKCEEEIKEVPPSLDLFNTKEKTNHFFNAKSCPSDSENVCNIYSKPIVNADISQKDKFKEEIKKRKEKKRKERKSIVKDDDNSLDVDAAGKAIEASLCADVTTTDTKRVSDKPDLPAVNSSLEPDVFRFTDGDDSRESSLVPVPHKNIDQIKKDIKEKRKKKKKNREDRQNRKEHHHHHHHRERSIDKDNKILPDVYKSDFIDPIDVEKSETPSVIECKPTLPSPSLPRLTDSPPPNKQIIATSISPIKETVTSPKLNPVNKPGEIRRVSDKFIPGFGVEIDDTISENAVKSISDFEISVIERNDCIDSKLNTSLDCEIQKTDDKIDEKPRAIISQEETEDAVAALLGESFGSRSGVFNDCYSENTQSPEAPVETIRSETNDNILDEEAEEMRQAVQNLNASELEIKPETPQSENDLQIDTDTDDESRTESPPKTQNNSENQQPESQTVPFYQPQPTPVEDNPEITPIEEPIIPSVSKEITEDVSVKIVTDVSEISPPKILEKVEINTPPPTVISKGWSLNAHKPNEQPLLITQPLINATNPVASRDEKPVHIAASILLKAQAINVGSPCRPLVTTSTKVPGSYQVLNQIPRPTTIFNSQPPTIKIPDQQHVIYQRQPSIMISPRMTGDIRLHSPKSHQHMDIQPKVILTAGPPSLAAPPGLTSSSNLQQRSPGQITVVRMQQPPLSPIQNAHIPVTHQSRSLLSPGHHNTVVIQSQSSPVQLNRLPITPVLAPISKTVINNNVSVQPPPKAAIVNSTSSIIQPPMLVSAVEVRKNEPKITQESVVSNSKLIFSASGATTPQSPSITVQNRLSSPTAIQNPQGSILVTPHILNKAGLNMTTGINLADKINESSSLVNGPDQTKNITVSTQNMSQATHIHVNNANQTSGQVIQSISKGQLSIVHELPNPNKQNVAPRYVSPVVTNIVQQEQNKDTIISSFSPSISKIQTLNSSAYTISKPTVLNIIEKSPTLQIINSPCQFDAKTTTQSSEAKESPVKDEAPIKSVEKAIIADSPNSVNVLSVVPIEKAKCETDFEELLKQTAIMNKIEKPAHMAPNNNLLNLHSDANTIDKKEIKVEMIKPNETTLLSNKENKEQINVIDTKNNLDSKEDSDCWSAKDVNIDSVIKKVDALCNTNEISDVETVQAVWDDSQNIENKATEDPLPNVIEDSNPKQVNETTEDLFDKMSGKVNAKRGGRARGRKVQDRITERVQTRQGNKTRGTSVALAKRGGRGRIKVEKKLKIPSTIGANLPGDVYDFHEDSGDEINNTPQNKGEQRPRLILTIKSPLAVNIAPNLSTNSATTLPVKETISNPKILPVSSPLPSVTKDEKASDFVSPVHNTRKSRRLQEKDVTRNTVDDVIDDVVKNSLQPRSVIAGNKDTGPIRRSARQNIAKMAVVEKLNSDVRKSPRANKKVKDRRASETSVDSSDEKNLKKDNTDTAEIEIKPKTLDNITTTTKIDIHEQVSHEEQIVTTIVKPPKKMHAEVAAKLCNAGSESTSNVLENEKLDPKIAKPIEQDLKIIIPSLDSSKDISKPRIVVSNNVISNVISKVIDEKMKSLPDDPEEWMIDPVTGELVCMRHSDDGNFVPVSAGADASVVSRISNNISTSNNRMIIDSKISPQSVTLKQHQTCITIATSTHTSTSDSVLVSSVVKPLTPVVQVTPSRIQTTQNIPVVSTSSHPPQNFVSESKIVNPQTSVVASSTMSTSANNVYPSVSIITSVTVTTSGNIVSRTPSLNVQSSNNQSMAIKGHVISSVPTMVTKSNTVNTIVGKPSVPQVNLQQITPLIKINTPQLPSVVSVNKHIGSGPLSPRLQTNLPLKIQAGQQLKTIPMQPQIAHPPQKQVQIMQIAGQAGGMGPGPLGPSLPRGAQGQHASPPLLMAKHIVGPQPVIAGASSSRINLTGVPSISPQGQVAMHTDMLGARSPPPAHQQTSPVTPGEGVYSHFAHQHYQQHYFRTHQEARTTPSPYVARSPHGAEGSEAPSPPLELRRPPCARVPHPAHSPSLSDRSTDSPQVAQIYSLNRPSSRAYVETGAIAETPTGGRYYESPAPPPAHVPRAHHPCAPPPAHRILVETPNPTISKLPMNQGPGIGITIGGSIGEERGPSRGSAPAQGGAGQSQSPPGPPHASHAPREADSLMMLLRRYPVMWQGLLALKNDAAAVQMHFVHGNPAVATQTLPCNGDGSTPPLRIAQRMRLEPVQLEAVARKMQMENEHCMLLALPCGRDHLDVLQQSTHLTGGFITYLRRKQAAGIVNVAPPGHHQALFTVHIFPSCDFANENLERIAPDLLHRVADIAHLLIVIATV